MADAELNAKTIALIDSLKTTTGEYGLANGGSEYRIITEIFLYKFFNDKFGYEAKHIDSPYKDRLSKAPKWDAEYDTFNEDEVEDLFTYLPRNVPRLKPHQTLAHLYNASGNGDFSTLLDSTLIDISSLNSETFSVTTSGKTKVQIFSAITTEVKDTTKRDNFARSLMSAVASFNFESVFNEKYDFFSGIFQYLIKDYNNAGGGKYAEYYTPREIATVMAMLLLEDNKEYKGTTCYDPSAGTGTLLMALAHQIGEDRCSIYSQDISDKSSEMLRLNLILNNLVGSLPNIVQGNTLLEPFHKETDGTLKKFNFVVSNPPFKLDFPEYQEKLASDGVRFWAGVPNKVKTVDPNKPKMAIYTCFIQHVINSLKSTGRGAIVVPTGFITAKSGIEKKILERIVNDHIIFGVVSMPSNVFATTGTNVSVLFFDRTEKKDDDKVILIDASKLGEEYKEGNNQKRRLRPKEVEKIVKTFRNKETVEDFSVAVSYEAIKEKGYSLSAGQYFDIKIDYIDGNTLVYDDNVAYVPPSFVEPEQKIKKHDIIMTMSSGSKEHVGKCTMFQSDSEHTYGAFMTKFTPNSNCPFFAYRSMLSAFFKAKIKYICGRTGINNLTNQTFDEILFPFPSKDVLEAFEKLLTPIYEKVGKNNKEILKLTALRDELLPMLMNGQVRVK